MKIPKTPRPMGLLIKDYADKIQNILNTPIGPTPGGKYLHWDTMRHLDPPGNLEIEQWWLGVKFARFGLQHRIPLKDKLDVPFMYTMPPLVSEFLHQIDSRGSGRIAMPDEVSNPETRSRFLVRSLIEEAITSSQLEGASTTRQKAMEMFRSGRQPADKSERMIFNNLRGMEFIRKHHQSPLSPELVLEIHAEIMRDTIDDKDLGRLQTSDDKRVHVAANDDGSILHEPPPAEQLPTRLKEMCDFGNAMNETEFLHPVIRAILLHLWLAYDHPFEDGNGRTARALFYWSMLNSGYWIFEFISISSILQKASRQYAKAYLYTETDDNDATYFIVYQLQVIRSALQALELYLEKKTREIRKAEAQLQDIDNLNYRQMALLSHALRKPHSSFTINSHKISHRVAYATARSDLLALTKLGLLSQRMIGKTLYFEPGPVFIDKLNR
jgi:Fic family protein